MTRSWATISLTRLKHNLRVVRETVRQPSDADHRIHVIAVVKANAYGHGQHSVVRTLSDAGVRHFAVANLEEALGVRQVAPQSEILVLGGALEGEEDAFRAHDLVAAHFDSRPPPPGLRIDLKIDTGMSRLGVPPSRAAEIAQMAGPLLNGVCSHFSSADTDPTRTHAQIALFRETTEGFGVVRHLCNSAGLAYPEGYLDAVRPGLALYGISPVEAVTGLKPVLSWRTRILSAKKALAGSRVGYGGTHRLKLDSRIGILPVGYADGYDRRLSNRGVVQVRGRTVPVIGRVSMDLTTVDLTGIDSAKAGDEVTLISDDPTAPNSLVQVAERVGTIPYEVLTSIGSRVERVDVASGDG